MRPTAPCCVAERLDGTNVNQSFITGAGAPAGIAVSRGYIYWANQGANQSGTTIGRANLDGSAVNESSISGADSPAAASRSAARSSTRRTSVAHTEPAAQRSAVPSSTG